MNRFHLIVVTKVVTMGKRRPAKLSATFVKNVSIPGRYGDGRGGHGLSLLVKPMANGRLSKSWSQRLRFKGEAFERGLGSYPLVSLAMARDEARDRATRIARGEDIRIPERTVPTVAQLFDEVIAIRSPGWTHPRSKELWYTAKDSYKPIWQKSVADVTPADALKPVKPLWHEHNSKARKLLGTLCTVMNAAITEGYRTTNPARQEITHSLGKVPEPDHHQSLPPDELGAALALVRDCDAWWAARCCIIFLAFTGVRSGECRGATWNEFDLERAIWTIPAARMKNRNVHKVPLCIETLELLAYAKEKGGGEGFVFPAERGGAMNDIVLSRLLSRLGIGCVPHGFRGSFSNWAGGAVTEEGHAIPEPVSEMVLAHKPSAAIVKAYRTSDFFERRVPVMQEWASFLKKTMGQVVPVDRLLSKNPRDQIIDETTGPVISPEDQGSEMDTGATDLEGLTEAVRQLSFDQLLAFDKTA